MKWILYRWNSFYCLQHKIFPRGFDWEICNGTGWMKWNFYVCSSHLSGLASLCPTLGGEGETVFCLLWAHSRLLYSSLVCTCKPLRVHITVKFTPFYGNGGASLSSFLFTDSQLYSLNNCSHLLILHLVFNVKLKPYDPSTM